MNKVQLNEQQPEEPKFSVVVSNVGTVVCTDDHREAYSVYLDYRQQSIDNVGMVAGESITLINRDEGPKMHYAGTHEQQCD